MDPAVICRVLFYRKIMMYFPQECRIGGATYRILCGSNDLVSEYAGYINFRKKVITINNDDTSLTTQKESLLHEILHGIDELIGAGNRVQEEENTARADALFAFMRDDRNKRIIQWIMNESDEGETIRTKQPGFSGIPIKGTVF
jgi:hypothetical protein